MSMTINLLPWREVRREKRTRQFYGLVLLMLFVGVACGLFILQVYQQQLAAQQQRNSFLSEHLEQLSNDIADVRRYQDDAKHMEDRMAIYHMLNKERTSTVRLFNDIAASVSEGVVYQHLSRTEDLVRLSAIADSERQVSDQLRKIAGMSGFGVPLFSEVAGEQNGSQHVFQFEVIQLPPDQGASMETAP
jgi:type IV pilus assembly protein PilN